MLFEDSCILRHTAQSLNRPYVGYWIASSGYQVMIMPVMAQKGRKCGAWDATSAARLDVVVGDTESLLSICIPLLLDMISL